MWTDHVFTKSECLTWIPPSFSSKFRIKIALVIHLIICVDAQLSKKAQKVDALDGVHQMSHVMTKAYDNSLKRRLDSYEIKIMKIEKQILIKMLEKITKEYEELKKITNEYEELKRVYTLMKQE